LQKLLYNSVLPTVRELTDIADHLVIILPTLLALIANSTDDEYRSLLVPELRKVITMTRPVQVSSAANYYSKRVPRTNCALRMRKCASRISSGIYFLSTS